MKNTLKQLVDNLTDSETTLWNSDFSAILNKIIRSHQGTEVISLQKTSVSRRPRCKFHGSMPITFLPNGASYESKKNLLSIVDMLFSNEYRTWKEGNKFIGWKNSDANDYVRYMMNRLGHNRDKGLNKEYWRTGMSLLRNPNFQVLCFNRVAPYWYKDMPLTRVKKILQEVEEISREKKSKLVYKRVYIPKANGKLRPLGVPTLAWRTYMHMLNILVVWFRMDKLDSQHAYIPGRGVNTAWSEIFQKLDKHPNIYEFDLKGFFDNVDLKYNHSCLLQLGVPQSVADYLLDINKSLVELTQVDQLPEPHRKILFDTDGKVNSNLPDFIRKDLDESSSFNKSKNISKYLSLGYSLCTVKGVPQGASTSCGLSTINLSGLFKQLQGMIMYSDDGLCFPPSEVTPSITDREAGVFQNLEKSGWVKKDKLWINNLKFLGLIYIPANQLDPKDGSQKTYPRLRADTRSGSKLEYGERQQFQTFLNVQLNKLLISILSELEKDEKEVSHLNDQDLVSSVVPSIQTLGDWVSIQFNKFKTLSPNDKLAQLFNTGPGARMLSCLYNGSWSLNEPSDNTLCAKKGSWLKLLSGQFYKDLDTEDIILLLTGKLSSYTDDLIFESDNKKIRLLQSRIEHLKFWISSLEKIDQKGETNMWAQLYKNRNADPSTNSLLCFHALDSLFKKRKSSTSANSSLKFEFTKLQLDSIKLWKSQWIGLYKEIKVNLYTSSTFACSDLLNWVSKGKPTNWGKRHEVLYVKFQNIPAKIKLDPSEEVKIKCFKRNRIKKGLKAEKQKTIKFLT